MNSSGPFFCITLKALVLAYCVTTVNMFRPLVRCAQKRHVRLQVQTMFLPPLQPQLDLRANQHLGRASPNQNLSSEYIHKIRAYIHLAVSGISQFVFFTISYCSGDIKRENRFVRAVPRLSSQPIRRPGDRLQRPAIINPEDLKDLDELDNDCEDGWAGQY